jgi:hypothetical protein
VVSGGLDQDRWPADSAGKDAGCSSARGSPAPGIVLKRMLKNLTATAKKAHKDKDELFPKPG